MKKQQSEILKKDIKRNKTITKYLSLIIIISTILISFITIYINNNKTEYIKYKEQGNVDYTVYLKKNNFFEEKYLKENNQYISTLIEKIQSNFKYNLTIEKENIINKYTYKIISNVKVTDKTTKKNLYDKTEILLPEKEIILKEKQINILEPITIDYNKYNNQINNFINIYEVGNIESNLTVNMIINLIGSNEYQKESIITLKIPLTTNTIDIDMKDDLVDTKNNIIKHKKQSKYNQLFILIAAISLITDILLITNLVLYIKKTRNKITNYKKEIKKILRNYKQYIQKINNTINYKKYEKINLSTFTDLLEIRDTVQSPILMLEEKTHTKFIIPIDNILYIYTVTIKEK